MGPHTFPDHGVELTGLTMSSPAASASDLTGPLLNA
jgi:hypothetical protein